MSKPTIERSLKFIRLLIGVSIAYVLIHITISYTGVNVWEEIIKANHFLLVFSLLFYSGSLYLSIERLNILLCIQNIQIHKWDITKLTMIGIFFSLVIPGAVSGDLIKMVYLAKQSEKKKTEAVLTIFLDRVIGMLGLMVVTAALILWYLPWINKLGSHYKYIQSAILGLGLGSIFGVLTFFLLLLQSYKKIKFTGKLYGWVHSKLPQKLLLLVDRLIVAIDLYQNNVKVILKTILLSMLIHIWLGANLFLVGRCVGESIMNLRDYMLASQVGNLIAVLPITPGGVGTRDIGAAIILKTLGAIPEMAGVIPIIMTLIIIFWRLVGGGFFIFSNFPKSKIKENIIVSKRENPL